MGQEATDPRFEKQSRKVNKQSVIVRILIVGSLSLFPATWERSDDSMSHECVLKKFLCDFRLLWPVVQKLGCLWW